MALEDKPNSSLDHYLEGNLKSKAQDKEKNYLRSPKDLQKDLNKLI